MQNRSRQCQRIYLTGLVQGVGFRPFVWRLADRLGLGGWVRNTTSGVEIEVEGPRSDLDAFLAGLDDNPPPLSRVDAREVTAGEVSGVAVFEVLHSSDGGEDAALVLPDVAVCPDCLSELIDPADRRHGHPFITCTNCGPRFTIVESVPYDRSRTSMKEFPLCAACRQEYEDPKRRRFHAEAIACPNCGPEVSLLETTGRTMSTGQDAIRMAREKLSVGEIVAVKGLGGFHLACDARNDAAVSRLRARKKRPHRPLAVMCRDIALVRQLCEVSEAEEHELMGPRKPIVLLARRERASIGVSPLVAPGHQCLGVMLPYTPLHELLLASGDTFCMVMTSANRAGEPIVGDAVEALEKLSGIADAFLSHARPIVNRCDDSVGYIGRDGLSLIRRSRGFCPLPVPLDAVVRPTLALGAMFSSTFAVAKGRQVTLSQHIGDVDSVENLRFLTAVIDDYCRRLNIEPELIVHDMHPDLLTTRLAHELASGRRCVAVQHHHAHLVSTATAAGIVDEVQGVVFDGTGWAPDGTVWGGELLIGSARSFERVGHLLPLPLPGGDAAIRRPLRIAVAYIHALVPDLAETSLELFRRANSGEVSVVRQMIDRGINTPMTSSVGRLFDAVAAILGVCDEISYDGQAAAELEQLAFRRRPIEMDLTISDTGSRLVLDPTTLLRRIVGGVLAGEDRAGLAAGFHQALARTAATACSRTRDRGGPATVVLCGGVFQNRLLVDMTRLALESMGLRVVSPGVIPAGDGGLALGQVLVANCSRQ